MTVRKEMDEEQIIPPRCPWMSAAETIKEEYLRLLCETCEVLLKMKQRAWNVLSVGGFKAHKEREREDLHVCFHLRAPKFPAAQTIYSA